MAKVIGGDLVGMSTTLEAIAARQAASRCSASRSSPTSPPASPTSRSATPRCSRPARPPPNAAGACSPTSWVASDDHSRHRRDVVCRRAGLARRRPRPDDASRARRRPRPRGGGRRGGGRRPRRPLVGPARVRHGRAARRARRRPQPDEPRRRHPSGRRPRGIPQGRGPGRRVARRSSSATTRATTPTSSPATPPPSSSPPAGRALLLPQPLPTPVLAFAIRHLGADAGVMVTASHNPPQDNGYKVYLGDGSQIVPPADAQIAAHIARVERVADVPRAADGWETLGDDLVEHYVDAVVSVVDPASPRDLRIVHTSLHGVGHAHGAHGVRPGRLPGPGRRRRAGRARPGLPDRRLPQPRGEGRHRPRARPRPRGRAATSSSPTTPTPTGARRPSWTRPSGTGGCCGATRSARCSGPTSCAGASRGATSSPTRSCPRACSRRSPRRPDCGTRRP